MGALASRERLPVRRQLGEQPGVRVSQPLLVMDLLPAGRSCSETSWISRPISAVYLGSRARHCALSVHLFFAQYSSAGRGSGAVLHRGALPRTVFVGTLERSWVADHIAGSTAPGSSRWTALRA